EQANRPLRGREGTVILHTVRDEEEGPARLGFDLAVIDNAGGRWRPLELPEPAHGRFGWADGDGGSDKAAHIDHRIWTKIEAILVHQYHQPVGVETAEEMRRVRIQHAIPYHRDRGGLVEGSHLARCDIELLPVNSRVARSGDVQTRAVLDRSGCS